ncbi:MarR family winged helix-turn-helix transcriptional regulator [Microbacterium sp. NPDC088619]|uniref:MarR family winged helix-turn-helix transcriptional regulator n=1 Tax=Microbacterium sp. NPDC088619 TaxID=3364196 RepID=UPI0037F6A204
MTVTDRMDFFDALVRYETDLWNAAERELQSETHMGLGTLQALRVIASHAPVARVNEVSRDLGITIGAASKFVDRLERDGLAARAPHPDDRRSSLVTLTQTGERARREGEGVLVRSLERLVGDVDLTAATTLLTRLQARLGTLAEGDAS